MYEKDSFLDFMAQNVKFNTAVVILFINWAIVTLNVACRLPHTLYIQLMLVLVVPPAGQPQEQQQQQQQPQGRCLRVIKPKRNNPLLIVLIDKYNTSNVRH